MDATDCTQRADAHKSLFGQPDVQKPKKGLRPSAEPKPDRAHRTTPRAYKPKETKQQKAHANFYAHVLPPPRKEEENFRHSHWRVKRAQVRDTLATLARNEMALNRWDGCGGECTVEWHATTKTARLRANYCHSRHCEPCQAAKAGRMARNLRAKLDATKAGTVRFVTLTLLHTDTPLADQLKRLYRAFKILRKDPAWSRSQKGGAAILEVKHNGKHWHPHLHILVEGEFLKKMQLSDMWHRATGDSFIVDIQILTDHKDAAHYLSKYVTKGTTGNVWCNRDLAQEWITATKGIRTANTFGTWRGFKLLESHVENDGWVPLMPLHVLIGRAAAGDIGCQGILASLRPPGRATDVPRDGHFFSG